MGKKKAAPRKEVELSWRGKKTGRRTKGRSRGEKKDQKGKLGGGGAVAAGRKYSPRNRRGDFQKKPVEKGGSVLAFEGRGTRGLRKMYKLGESIRRKKSSNAKKKNLLAWGGERKINGGKESGKLTTEKTFADRGRDVGRRWTETRTIPKGLNELPLGSLRRKKKRRRKVAETSPTAGKVFGKKKGGADSWEKVEKAVWETAVGGNSAAVRGKTKPKKRGGIF